MKFKMAATAGLSLTLNPMGKMFQNASSLKPLGQLKPNCQKKIFLNFPIWSCVNTMIYGGSHLGFRIGIKNPNLDWTLWENVQMPSFQKLQI
jgi:hypothetical protein